MKKVFSVLFIVCIIMFGFRSQHKSVQEKLQMLCMPTESDERGEVKEWEERMLADPATGLIPAGIHHAEMEFAREFAQHDALAKSKQLTPWDLRGPYNVGGRTRAFAIDVTNDSILFAGGVSGGLWRSTNRGNSWTRVTNKHYDPDVVSIAQDTRAGHTNTWYYSSGEGTGTSASGGNSFYLGDGLYKSTDGGLTWDSIPSTAGGNPNSFTTNYQMTWNLVTDPHDLVNDVVYFTAYNTLYRSINGGTSWTAVKSSSGSYYADVAIDTAGILYCTFSSDGSGKGIFRSTDGTTWTNILPSNFNTIYGYTKVGINPQNHNEVYFLVSNTDTTGSLSTDVWGTKEYTALWKYTYLNGNGSGSGGTWTNLSANLPQGAPNSFDGYHSQGGYNVVIKVHPTLPNTIFIGGTNIYRSTDGFTSPNHTTQIGGYAVGTHLVNFQLYANHHPDQHEILFLPSNPNVMLSGCDGGVYKTDSCMNPGSVHWQKLDKGYFTTQFYTAQLSPDYTNDIVFGGLQDNGIFWTNSTNITSPWKMSYNGDGAWLDMSNDGQTYYLSIQEGKVIKAHLDNTGAITSFARIDPSYVHNRRDYQFVNQFVIDKSDDKIMYQPAGRKLFRNDDLSAIPFANNTDSIATNWVQFPDTLTGSNTFTAIACSRANPTHTLYVGTATKKVYRIDNANIGTPHMTDISTGLPSGYVTCIAIDPVDANNVVVAFSNYNMYSIYQSTNAGASWSKVAGNLEKNLSGSGNAPSIRWISIMPFQGHNKYFCGTSIGLFSADSLAIHDATNPGTQWTQEGLQEFGNTIVPHVFCRDIDQMVAVATHGSGIYTNHYGWNVGVGNIANTATNINVYPNPTHEKVNVQWQNISEQTLHFTLYDLSGKIVFDNQKKYSLGKNSETIDLSSLSSGVYLLTMNNGKENFTKKIIVQ